MVTRSGEPAFEGCLAVKLRFRADFGDSPAKGGLAAPLWWLQRRSIFTRRQKKGQYAEKPPTRRSAADTRRVG